MRTSYDLDKQVNVLRITEPRARYVESYQLDIQDRVTSVINIENQVLSIDYGVGDFIRQITRFDGSTITNTHDTAGRISTSTYNPGSASPVAISYSYWPDGELKTIADSTSSTTNTYDPLNRLTNQGVQIGSLQSEIGKAFDPVGNLTNSVLSVGGSQVSATTYAYDAAERLKAISATDAGTFSYTYNPANGAIATVSNTVSGITTSYEYDLLDRTTNIACTASDGSLIRSLGYEYDAASMIKNKTMVGGSGSTSTAYVYDSLDRLVHESKTSSVGSSLFDNGYSYDLAGNRTSKISNGWETTYLHTNGNRLASLTSAQAATNTLFVSGIADELIGTDNRWGELWLTNLTSGATVIPNINGNTFFATIPATTGQTNSLHVAIPDRAGNMGYATKDFFVGTASGTPETKTYEYDSAGNTTNLNGVSLDWDERYRLTRVDDASSFVEYEYDVLNRRISRTEGGTTNYFIYNGNQAVADLDGSGNLLRTYVSGAGIDNLLCFTDHTTSNTYYAIKDHQNSVIALVDENGSVVESYEYSAYGETRVFNSSGTELTESAFGNRYCFQCREIDWTTGLYCFRARWYDPEVGRWLSKDPIGISGGLNQYVFVGNNPVNFIDPLGLVGGITGAVVANKIQEAGEAAGNPVPKDVAKAIAKEMTKDEVGDLKDAKKNDDEEKMEDILDKVADRVKKDPKVKKDIKDKIDEIRKKAKECEE